MAVHLPQKWYNETIPQDAGTTKGQDMNDTLKFAAMLLAAALIWMIVNPVTLVVALFVWAFGTFGVIGVGVIAGVTALAVTR